MLDENGRPLPFLASLETAENAESRRILLRVTADHFISRDRHSPQQLAQFERTMLRLLEKSDPATRLIVARKLSSMKSDVRQRSLLEKFLCYAQGWKDGHVQARYGWDHFRVIVMTTSPERVARMVDVVQEVAKDRNLAGCRGLFLFGETASFSQSSLLGTRSSTAKASR